MASLTEVQTPATSDTPETPITSPETPAPAETVKETPSAAEIRKWKLKDPEGEFEVDEQELQNGHLRFRDYTRKTQTLAEERKRVEAAQQALTEREEKINTLLSKKENVAQWYEMLTGEKLTKAEAARVEQGLTPTPGAGNQDEVATLAEAERIATARVSEVQAKLEKQMLENLAKTKEMTETQIAEAAHKAAIQKTAVEYQSDIQSTITALGEKYPLLGQTYEAGELEELLVRDVMKANPESLDAAKQMLESAAKERYARLEKVVVSKKKEDAVAAAQLNSGIEPKGGTNIGHPAVKHKLGDKNLTASAIAFMESHQK